MRTKANCAVNYQPATAQQSKRPKFNAFQIEDVLHVEFSLPGVLKEHLKLHLENQILTLQAQRKMNYSDDQTVLHKEFGNLNYEHKIQLPEDVDTNSIQAQFEHGVLKLRMNRVKKPSHTIEIQ